MHFLSRSFFTTSFLGHGLVAMETPSPRLCRALSGKDVPSHCIVDAYSKYLEVVPMSHTTISALRHVFSSSGLPEHAVTDNGSQLSRKFQKFLSDDDIHHTATAPRHPATNGLAERYMFEILRINYLRWEKQVNHCKQSWTDCC